MNKARHASASSQVQALVGQQGEPAICASNWVLDVSLKRCFVLNP